MANEWQRICNEVPSRFFVSQAESYTLIRKVKSMFDFNKNKNRKRVASIIIVVVIIAMVATSVLAGIAG